MGIHQDAVRSVAREEGRRKEGRGYKYVAKALFSRRRRKNEDDRENGLVTYTSLGLDLHV